MRSFASAIVRVDRPAEGDCAKTYVDATVRLRGGIFIRLKPAPGHFYSLLPFLEHLVTSALRNLWLEDISILFRGLFQLFESVPDADGKSSRNGSAQRCCFSHHWPVYWDVCDICLCLQAMLKDCAKECQVYTMESTDLHAKI